MSRRGLAGLVLAVWALTIAWHVKREFLQPGAERLAEAARGLPPGPAYYRVHHGDRQVGWARSLVDTLPPPGGFLVRDLLEATDSPVGALRLETEAELSPRLSLRRFSAVAVIGAKELRADGEVLGDTLLVVRLLGPETSDTVHTRLSGPVVPTVAWPLRVMARSRLRRGDRFRLPLFDPLTGVRESELRLLARERRSYTDSAATDAHGRWRAAREDTLLAWHVEQETAGLRLRSWVGEDGRLLETTLPGGLRLERTAFELAFPAFAREAAQ